jgi:hypothetical protein
LIRASAKVVKTVDKIGATSAAIRKIADRAVMVGIPSTRAGRESKPGELINNAAIGYIHEMGSPARNIPARPWLLPGVRRGLPRIVPILREVARRALTDPASIDRGLNAAGLMAMNEVRDYLTTAHFAPLAEATLAARRRRGVIRDRPLLDTLQMLHAVDYVIRRRRA